MSADHGKDYLEEQFQHSTPVTTLTGRQLRFAVNKATTTEAKNALNLPPDRNAYAIAVMAFEPNGNLFASTSLPLELVTKKDESPAPKSESTIHEVTHLAQIISSVQLVQTRQIDWGLVNQLGEDWVNQL